MRTSSVDWHDVIALRDRPAVALLPPLTLLSAGLVPSTNTYTLDVTIPDLPGLVGSTVHVQALVLFGGPLRGDFTDTESFVVN